MTPHDVAWFMHHHPGYGNTLVGVWPTPIGVYVRSWMDAPDATYNGVVTFYPMQPATRVVDDVVKFNRGVGEDQIVNDVIRDYRERCKKAGRMDLVAATV